MEHSIYPCLWLDSQARTAADFYCSLFTHSRVVSDNPLVTLFELEGQKIMGLNGGPKYRMNPSISLFVTCDTPEEVDRLWNQLMDGGQALMPLDRYPWCEHYGWCADKFGLTWQLFLGDTAEVKQKIVPLLLFSDTQYGKAGDAITFYTSVFRNAAVETLERYGKDAPQAEGHVMHSRFRLNDGVFMAMDGPGDHQFSFNEGISLVLPCENQAQIDYYWEKFISDGGEESMCGWCKDKFGVSWQVVPAELGKLMSDPEKSQRVMQAFLQMRKFDIEKLRNA